MTVSTSSGKKYGKRQKMYDQNLNTPIHGRENMETFSVNSEKKLDANNHPCYILYSILLSMHTRAISRTGRVHSTSTKQLSTYIKDFVY